MTPCTFGTEYVSPLRGFSTGAIDSGALRLPARAISALRAWPVFLQIGPGPYGSRLGLYRPSGPGPYSK
jgi:hypothetical protein